MKKSVIASLLATSTLSLFACGFLLYKQLSTPEMTVQAQAPSAVGAWFGVARPCPASADDSQEHKDLCAKVCGLCPSIPNTLPPEVPMMPTLLADGTVVADDAGEIGAFHTPAHGSWSEDRTSPIQIEGRTRLQATFLWLQSSGESTPGNTCCFAAAIRPRFVTFFDRKNPDAMQGFIQPYFFPIVHNVGGQLLIKALPTTTQFHGNHLPEIDPIAPLPGCSPENGCLGTYHFTIRRIGSR